MDFSKTFAISAAGMAVERTRVEVAALNLANANTVQGPEGQSFQPLRVIARSALAGGSEASPAAFFEQVAQGLGGAELAGLLPEVLVEPDGAAPRRVLEPGNPLADEKGFVAYPGVDAATEMVNLMAATRAYEANVAAMNSARALALKTLEIGGGQ
jgi:flagellar basal-body rod protein FlgC